MNSFPAEHPPQPAQCAFAWCTTEHGRTVHPDDETHRSAGVGLRAHVREGLSAGAGVLTRLEVGLVRGLNDRETWVALEFGAGCAIAIDAVTARTLGRLLRDDPDIAAAIRDDA